MPLAKRPSKTPKLGKAASRRPARPVEPHAPVDAMAKRSDASLAAAEEEIGRLMGHAARLEKELRELRGLQGAALDAPAAALAAAADARPNAAIAKLAEGLDAMREVLIGAAQNLEAFAKREFDLFDPRAATLIEVRSILLRAAGQSGKLPPPIPRPSIDFPVFDITDLAEALESLRPMSGAASVAGGGHRESIRIPAYPPLRVEDL